MWGDDNRHNLLQRLRERPRFRYPPLLSCSLILRSTRKTHGNGREAGFERENGHENHSEEVTRSRIPCVAKPADEKCDLLQACGVAHTTLIGVKSVQPMKLHANCSRIAQGFKSFVSDFSVMDCWSISSGSSVAMPTLYSCDWGWIARRGVAGYREIAVFPQSDF